MNVDLVVDVGNSRIKWGRCRDGGVADTASLNSRDPSSWQQQLQTWQLSSGSLWAVSGVNPQRVQQFLDWLHQCRQHVVNLSSWRQLPLKVQVEFPDQVGIDRLLNAVAAKSRMPGDQSALIVDAGTAVTVDWVDDQGAFRGGAILPGLQLMAQALHDHTALLPLVQPPREPPLLPGISTVRAIEAGVFWTVVGGVRALIGQVMKDARLSHQEVFLTGGDAQFLEPVLEFQSRYWPQMTLEGIRMAAQEIHERSVTG